jgi:hypothetical protein
MHCSRQERVLLVAALKFVLFKPGNVRIMWKNADVLQTAEKITAHIIAILLQHVSLKLF